MPYTFTSVASLWLFTLALLALTGSGAITGPWLLFTIGIALAGPVFILRKSTSPISPTVAATTPPERPERVTGRDPSEAGEIDVYRWENEGGARRLVDGRRIGVPAPVVR
jgi:hypothetical protein